MKKILPILITVLAFTACKKEPTQEETTLQVINNTTLPVPYGDLNGSLYDVILHCYGKDYNLIREYNLPTIQSLSSSDVIKLNSEVRSVKLSFKRTLNLERKRTKNYFNIDVGEFNQIVVDVVVYNNVE